MGGCTNCSEKEGCSHRKGAMFTAIDSALERLYVTRRWGELSPLGWRTLLTCSAQGREMASELSSLLKAEVRFRPGEEEDYCDFLEVLCVGRPPSLLDLAAGRAPLSDFEGSTEEVYLRVCLSRLDPLATVQQVTLFLDNPLPETEAATPHFVPEGPCFVEQPRAGVYDAILLARLQKIVAWLPDKGYVSVDFGDITTPAEGYAPGDYASLYGEQPALVNYLFYGPPSTMQRIFTVPAWRTERAEATG